MTESIQEKVGQMLMVGFYGLTLPEHIRDWLQRGQIGGVILFSRNVESPQQIAELTRQVREAAQRPVLIGIDQEGGVVSRLREGFLESPGAMALASAANSEELTGEMSQLLGYEMHALGINWTYAPVVDISYNAGNPSLGVRSFGNDPEQIAQLAYHAVKGFQRAGVAACAKHFPGLGDTAIDTHLALPRLEKSVEDLRQRDLIPYKVVIDAGVATIMTTHTIFEEMDNRYPATLSPVVVNKLLREELGYDGLVTTDCLEMKAITDNYSVEETAVLAMQAGIDILLVSHTREIQQQMFDAMVKAVEDGRVSMDVVDAANTRIARTKAQFSAAHDFNPEDIRKSAHIQQVVNITQQTITLLKDDPDVFPLAAEQQSKVGLIEFASYMDSEVIELGGQTGLRTLVNKLAPQMQYLVLQLSRLSEDHLQLARKLAEECEILVIATRSAHLNPDQEVITRELIQLAGKTILLCLRNPFDAELFPEADVILCSSGDSSPSLEAMMNALVGHFKPTGKLPV